jgi:hypothetical protein
MDPTTAPTTENITVKAPAPAAEKSHLWAGDHFSFHDVLDAINPLQHIPIVGTVYRAVTGDTLGNAARVVGDGLYGGVIGVIAGLVDVSVLENTGKDIGGNVLAALGLDDEASQSASADTPPDPSPTSGTPPVPARKPAPPPSAAPVATPVATQAAPAPAPPTGIPLASTQPQLMPLSTGPKMMALNSQARSFPIDTSAEGILALRTIANSAPRPVPLNIPAGTLAPNQRIPLTGTEFAQRMSEGLDKYKALVTERQAASAGTSVNQVQ